MPVTLNLTEVQTFTAARSFLLAILPAGTEVVRGQDNEVAEPPGANFVVLSPVLRKRLATNVETWAAGANPTTISDLQRTEVVIQCDVHGPLAADNAQVISTLFRTSYAVGQFQASGYDVVPLYADDPKQTPFLNGEQQYEYRWTIDLHLQANPIVTSAQDFANTLTAGVISVDEKYPP